ncbi:uncharacterized protein At4g26485-like [Helianthus annuus]|uniref:uncharacterized protein At4g26485-like n=1 Tax=Helianthus annuus TaxID=4232 RepID=UPI00165312FC|nr:uncharacterized protein At4g26485-like [Helianthus annuus]
MPMPRNIVERLYASWHKVLVVGDSNFEFSNGLAEVLKPEEGMMICSRPEKIGDKSIKSTNIITHLKNLKSLNVQVLAEVKPEKMHDDKRIRGDDKKCLRVFDRMIYYHPPSFQNAKEFVLSSTSIIHREYGEAHMVMKAKADYSGWDMIQVMKS